MIETLSTSEKEYILKSVEYDDIVTYCSVHKEEIESLSTLLSLEEKERFLSDVAQHQYDADAFDAAQKELVRVVYYLRRGTITETERMELLNPFFPDMTQRYSVLLDENIPTKAMMTFEHLLANLEKLYDNGVMRIFEEWEACTYLDRDYLKRYVAYVKESDAFRCLYHHERSRAIRFVKRFAGKIATAPQCTTEMDAYKTQMRDSLNIILLAIYFEQNPRPYYYMESDQLNMYQGLELEMDIEEALDALFLLKGEVDKYMDKAKRRPRPLRYLLSLLGR